MLMHNIELSLSRMKTDYVDIWQLHNASVNDVEKADLMHVMEDAKQQGKVKTFVHQLNTAGYHNLHRAWLVCHVSDPLFGFAAY
jgi:aryl-alcohol dehydrogenase-like predicted oxidoreductase